MKQRREADGLTLQELALETRITRPVIETLTMSAAVDRLPRRVYLASMRPQLERCLKLTLDVLRPNLLLLWNGICR